MENPGQFLAKINSRMPGRQLSKPNDDRRFALREIDFSPNFQRAMKAFGDRFTRDALDDDPLSPAGSIVSGMGRSIPPPPRTYRLSTVRTRTDQIRWAASALVKLGTPVAEIQCLDDLVTPIERVSDILRFFRDRAGGKRNATAGHVGEALRIVAKYVAGLEDREIEKIKLLTKSVAPQFVGMTEKNELIVHRALEERTYENLLRLPGTLISVALASQEINPVAARALAFRAAQLQFLLILPLRLDNVLQLRIGNTLKIPKPSCATGWVISIPLQETKNSNAIFLQVPEQVALILRQWIEKFKNPDSDYLFPGHVTPLRPMTPQAFREALKKTTRKYVGVEISPHVFRHIAANSYLREFPGHYEDVRRLLGHKAVATTTKFYSSGETISANKKFDALTLRLKGTEK